MSSQSDIAMIEQIIKGLLLPDNTARKEAEAKLSSLLPNREPLCICLSQLLNTSTEPLVQTYAAIIIRKLFIIKDDEIDSDIWKKFKPEAKTAIKTNMLSALTAAKTNQIKKKISDALVNIFTALSENDEKWEELLRFIVAGFNLELNEVNLPNIELCLTLLASVYGIAYDDLKEGSNVYIQCFANYFKSSSLSLKAKTVQCLSELLCSTTSKKETKKFREFMFYILETTLQCLNQNDNDNLKVCLESLSDLASCEPKILRKSFSDLFTLMGKIIENKTIDDNLREISFELLVSLIEGLPKVISKDTEKLNLLVQALFKYSMEMEDDITEEWLTPKAETYMNDEFIPEKKLDESCSLLYRLFDALEEKTLLPIVSKNIAELLSQGNTNWKYKYIAYITIAEIMEFIEDLSSIKQLIDMVLADLNNQNVKVQYSCIYCISELADNHDPDFQNEYHAKVLPALLDLMKSTKVLRIQLQICDALDCFIEHITDSDATKYTQNALDVLFGVFIKDDAECPPSLKEGILNVVDQFVDAANEDFKKYSEKCLTILLDYLNKVINEKKGRSIIGVLLETISTIGPLCPQFFKTYLSNVVDVLVQIHIGLGSFKENIGNYLLSTWEKVIPLLLENQKEKIPSIVESLLTLLKKPPEMSIASNPENKIDVASFFKEEEKDSKTTKKAELTTSETEEFASFIEILNLVLEQCPDLLINYVPAIYAQATVLLKYPNEDIQIDISETYSSLIKVLSKGDQAVLHTTAKQYIAELVTQLEKEKSFQLIVQMLDNVKEIIDTVKLFLVTQEINDLSYKILAVFDRVETMRLNLLKEKEETEKEVEEDKKKGDNKIYSDDEDDGSEEEIIDDIKDQIEEVEEVATAFNDFFGSLFNTHKELTLQVVEKLIKEYLPRYFESKSSNFEKLMGLYIINDMCKYLGQDLLATIWGDVAKILITYADNTNYEIRNNACYGIGLFAMNTKQNYNAFANDFLSVITRALKFPDEISKSEKDDMKFAKDNAISALGKIIKYHGKEIELEKWISVWIEGMPIEKDSEEGKEMNKFLMEILANSPQLVMGEGNKNIGHIVMILAKGYKSDFSEEETDKKIEEFVKGVKGNAELMNLVNASTAQMKGKVLNKIKELFN